MNVLIANTKHWTEHWQGAELYLYNLSRSLAEIGVDVSVISSTHLYHRGDIIEHGLGKSWMTVKGASENRWSELLDEIRPQVVHIMNPSSLGLSLIEAARKRSTIVVATIMDSWWECPKSTLRTPGDGICNGHRSMQDCASCVIKSRLGVSLPNFVATRIMHARAHYLKDEESFPDWRSRTALIQATLNKIDHVFFLSEDKLLSLGQAVSLPKKKMTLLPSPVSIEVANKHAQDFITAADKPIKIGFAGNFSQVKGFFLLLDALRLAHESLYLELHIAGAFPDKATKNRYSRLKVPFKIAMKGKLSRQEMAEFYRSIDLQIVPSICAENQPQVILEALALGTPTIGSDVPGIKELLQPAMTFRAADARELAQAIIDWTASPIYQPPAKSRPEWPAVATEVSKIYKRLTLGAPEQNESESD